MLDARALAALECANSPSGEARPKACHDLSTYTSDPGARVLWCLRRSAGDVRCVAFLAVRPVEVHVLQDRDRVMREVFATVEAALDWAEEYAARLKSHGWRECPEDCSPFSAA
jgi:hypothetical protein